MERPLSAAEIDTLLQSESYGHLGCCLDGIPYVVPMAFLYSDNALYGQTTEGRKVAILRSNPHACLQVERIGPNGWSSVMCHGTFEELAFADLHQQEAIDAVQELTQRIAALQHLMGIDVPFSLDDERPHASVVDGKKTTLFRIRITKKTGRTRICDE